MRASLCAGGLLVVVIVVVVIVAVCMRASIRALFFAAGSVLVCSVSVMSGIIVCNRVIRSALLPDVQMLCSLHLDFRTGTVNFWSVSRVTQSGREVAMAYLLHSNQLVIVQNN